MGRLGGGAEALYVVNGFYLRMRADYVRSGSAVRWLSVWFREADLPWADFRAKVVGATDPAAAAPGSIRREVGRPPFSPASS